MPSRSRRAPADGKRGIHQDLTDDAMDWVLLFFASFGCLILLAGLNVIYKANATAAWPTTTGTIVSAAVQKSPAGKTYYWVPNICFRYQVDGVTYTSCRYSASSLTSFFLSGTAERIVARHPPGSHRVIAYPPFEPQRAILVPGARPVLSSAMRLVIYGVVVIAIGFNLPPR